MPEATSGAPPLAVSVREATRLLGVSRSTVYRLISRNLLHARKCGNRTLVLVHSLHGFLATAPELRRADRR
jgi:excisionase family DNA binding protein